MIRPEFQVHTYAAGKVKFVRRKRAGKVELVKVDSRVLATAMKCADGDARRLTIVSATCVEVTLD